jgi:hypothetical protein
MDLIVVTTPLGRCQIAAGLMRAPPKQRHACARRPIERDRQQFAKHLSPSVVKTSSKALSSVFANKRERPLARARKEPWPPCLAKVIKKSISISQLLTERDQADNVRVLREAKAATHRIFDPATKQLVEVPDHKTRLAAIMLVVKRMAF